MRRREQLQVDAMVCGQYFLAACHYNIHVEELDMIMQGHITLSHLQYPCQKKLKRLSPTSYSQLQRTLTCRKLDG